jgi:hypothetical protein
LWDEGFLYKGAEDADETFFRGHSIIISHLNSKVKGKGERISRILEECFFGIIYLVVEMKARSKTRLIEKEVRKGKRRGAKQGDEPKG